MGVVFSALATALTLGRVAFICLGGFEASRRQFQSGMGLSRSSSELATNNAPLCCRGRDRRDGKRRGGLLADGSDGGRDVRCGTHFGAASRAAAAGARRTSYGATTNAIRAGFCFPDAARGCIQRDAAAGCGGRRARELRISSCERTWRPVDDAKPTQRCRVGRSSEDHDDGSAACTCSRD